MTTALTRLLDAYRQAAKTEREKGTYALQNQQPPVSKIDLHDLENSQIDWSHYQPDIPPALKPQKTPRPHQQHALDAARAGLKSADRGKLIMDIRIVVCLFGLGRSGRLSPILRHGDLADTAASVCAGA